MRMSLTRWKLERFDIRYRITLKLGRISLLFIALAILATVVRGMRAFHSDFPFVGPSLLRMWMGVLFGVMLLPSIGLGIDLAFRPFRGAWAPASFLLLTSLLALSRAINGGVKHDLLGSITLFVGLSFGLGFIWYVGASLSMLLDRRMQRRPD